MTAKLKEYSSAEINMMPKTARPINVAPMNEKDMTNKYADRKRTGKTKRDQEKKHGNKESN